MAAWNVFGRETTPEQLPEELRVILAEMKRERVAFEALTKNARESGESLSQIMQPIDDAKKVVFELQGRVKALERLVPVLATLDEQTETVSKVQQHTESQLAQNASSAKQLRDDVEELRGVLEDALALKNEVASFLELGGGFKALRMDADTLGGAIRELTDGFDQVRARQDELRNAGDAIAARLATFEDRQHEVQRNVTDTAARTATVGETLEELSEAAVAAAETKRQLMTLKALADGVTQKVAALEHQRDVVERATSEVGRLHDLMRDVDAKIRQHEEGARGLDELESRVSELKDLHAQVLHRSTEITANHESVKQADAELRARLNTLREDVQRAVQRFEHENQGLDAVGQRILDLRNGLTSIEGRFASLEESSRAIPEINARAEGLSTQLEGLSESVAELGTQAERVRELEASANRLGGTVEEMAQRVAQLERSNPGVQAALEDVAALRGTHETVKGAMEEIAASAAEMARIRAAQADTKAWLTGVTDQIDALRRELSSVDELKPSLESVRGEADRLAAAMGQIDVRGRRVDELNERLVALGNTGTELEERSRDLLTRMQGADERFIELAAHAEEAARIEKLVPAAVTTAERAERRVGAVDERVAALESRAQNLEGLAERTRALGQELELRQNALDKAAEHLDRVADLREAAATTAQQIEERSSQLNGAVSTAGNRLLELTATLDELDSRSGELRFAQKRMAQFEERFAQWEAVEAQLARAMEQARRRQATMDAIQADMHRLYAAVEKTADDVRSISAAREEIGETRATLETLLGMVTGVQDAAGTIDHRKRQVEQAEERLARAEAVLADIQASHEQLHAQKTLIDQAVTQTTALEFQTKQAESMIAALRQEREITDNVRGAVTQLRDGRRSEERPAERPAPLPVPVEDPQEKVM